MTVTIKDGGPAFPVEEYMDHPVHGRIHRALIGEEMSTGMSLRDYFAAKVLPTCITVAAEVVADSGHVMSDDQAAEFRRAVCMDVWAWADEMLASREQQS